VSEPIQIFPFGSPLRPVVQLQQPSRAAAFVLGVYASAVHARWIGPDGRTKVKALAVASEPYIFWRGDGAREMIGEILLPPGCGHLAPAAKNLKGPSGRALDRLFISPLGLTRDDCHLCDLVPHACLNDGQRRALEREYEPIAREFELPTPTIPRVPKKLASTGRRDEIWQEILQSGARTIVTLGDEPLRYFVSPEAGTHDTLVAYGDTTDEYGRLHDIEVRGRKMSLLPLVHPRQAAKLGAHSSKWSQLHEDWVEQRARSLLQRTS